jgi:pyridoxine 4-dehydrogenase
MPPWIQHSRNTLRDPLVRFGARGGHGATPAQVALAWLLAIADNVLLIPGTSSRGHLAENLAAGSLSLHNDEIGGLTSAFGTP